MLQQKTIEGRQKWCWFMRSFCDLYHGTDLSSTPAFIMFQIHLAFTAKNEDEPQPFKFGLLDVYCSLTARNNGVLKENQDWTLDLSSLQSWVAMQEHNLEKELADIKQATPLALRSFNVLSRGRDIGKFSLES